MVPKLANLHPGQLDVFTTRGRFNVLECGRRWGKTTFGVRLLCCSAIRGRRCGWFAPTQKLASESWIDMKRFLKPIIHRVNESERRIETHHGGVVDCWTLDNPDSGRGRKYHRIIIDEASIVRDLRQCWQETLRPTLTDYRGEAWFLGTPRGRNYFHQLFTKGQSGEAGWKSWRRGTTDNPFMSKEEVEAAKRELPEAAFNQEYLGLPADDGGNPFGAATIRQCVKPLGSGPAIVFGVDLGKSRDYTALVGLDGGGRTCVLERWQSDWSQTRERILKLTQGRPTLVDSTGVGDPVVEELQRSSPFVSGFKFSQHSKQQIMEGVACRIARETVGFPEGWLVQELESFEYQYHATGVRYSAPPGLHDDGVCALALAIHHLSRAASTPTLDVRLIPSGASFRQHHPSEDSSWD